MENYLEELKKLNLENQKYYKSLNESITNYTNLKTEIQALRDKLTADFMIPIPSNNNPLAFMKGTVVHTNELLVPLGAKYFAQMTVKDVMEYCDRKCKDMSGKQEDLLKEKNLLLERLSFLSLQNKNPTEIIEKYNEDEEKLWRQRHAQSIKNMKIQESVERQKISEQAPDDYFARLEELEAEELELNEL